MPSIEFYYMPESPPCRTVEMVAELVGVTLNKHYVNLFTKEHLQEEYVKINPRHKVPFIVDGDVKLNESRTIAKYLVNKYDPDNEHLYPKDPIQRAYIDDILDFELGTLYPCAFKLLGPKLFKHVEELNADDEKSYRDNLSYLDKKLGENGAKRFMFGDHLTIADVSLAATFTFPIACGYDFQDFKHLVAYLDRLEAAIPKYHEINDEPTENMRKYIQSKQEGVTDKTA